MKVQQFIKKLNNTELGKTGMNDTYISIPQNVDVSDIFSNPGEDIFCIDKQNGKLVKICFKLAREKRLSGLGRYYREKGLCAGDEVIIEKQEFEDGAERFFIDIRTYSNILVFQRMKRGFEVLTPERLPLVTNAVCLVKSGERKKVEVVFKCSGQKRGDSKKETNFYDILVEEESLMGEYSTKEYLELIIEDNNTAKIKNFCSWRKFQFTSED